MTNIVLGSNVTLVGASLFEGCLGVQTVSVPESVTRLGASVFKDCAALKSVTFEGDAPDMGEDVFLGTPRSLMIYVPEDSIGWSDDFSDELPSTWNGRRIAFVEGTGGTGGTSGGSEGGSSGGGMMPTAAEVSLTVTNVIVHYILNSVVPDVAVPISADTGFVTVVTEIKGGAVAIPESWAAKYSGFVENFGNDFSAALTKPSGKRDSQGNALMVWQDYVAGTDPTDLDDVFRASITMVDGDPHIGHTPELSPEEEAKRKYTTYGKVRLQDEEWSVVNGDAVNYNFFKVTVEMR